MVEFFIASKKFIILLFVLILACGNARPFPTQRYSGCGVNSHYVADLLDVLKRSKPKPFCHFVTFTHWSGKSQEMLTHTVVQHGVIGLGLSPLGQKLRNQLSPDLRTRLGRYSFIWFGRLNCLMWGVRPLNSTGSVVIGPADHRHKRSTVAYISFLLAGGGPLAILLYLMHVRQTADKEAQSLVSKLEQHQWLNAAPFGYYVVDNNGKFIEINDTLLHWLGYDRNDLINKMTITELIHHTEQPLFGQTFGNKTGSVKGDAQFTLVKKNGVALPVVLHCTSEGTHQSVHNVVHTIVTDNRERKFAQEQVDLLNQELESLSYSISHDLRAPLRSIDGYARILREDYADKMDEEGERVIHVILNNSQRMGELIDNLLLFSRLGRKELLKTATDMDAMVRVIVNEQLEREKKANGAIDIKIGRLHAAEVDVDMIKQVWANLVSNAIKYTGKTEHPRIEITSEATPNEICYTVKDNGVGFDMQYVEKLFGVFQRLHKIQEFSGTGVGLAIVKRIVNRHHGRVWADAAIDKGATFHFTIPFDNGK